MYRSIILIFLLIAFSTSALAEESDIQILDLDQERQIIIEQKDGQFDIFDRSYNRRGYIRNNNIYDNRWNRIGSIRRGGDARERRYGRRER